MIDSSAKTSPARTLIRIAVVAALALVILTIIMPGIARPWRRLGTFGFWVNHNGVVWRVDRNSTASEAGIRKGDRVDLSAVPFKQRAFLQGIQPAAFRDPATFRVIHDGNSRTVTLVRRPTVMSSSDDLAMLTHYVLLGLILVAVGAALVLLRPSLVTWGFYLYCLSLAGFAYRFWQFLSPSWFLVLWIIWLAFSAAGIVGFLVFALRFPTDSASGWRLAWERAAPFIFLLLLGVTMYADLAAAIYATPTEWLHSVGMAMRLGLFAVGVFSLLTTYRLASADQRQRIKWVILGLAIGVTGYELGHFLFDYSPVSFAGWRSVVFSLMSFTIVIPITVAYAIIRHRVLDIRFVVGRSLIYGVLVAIIVGAFLGMDWLMTKKLAETRLEIAVDIAAALLIGFWLKAGQQRLSRAVDFLFFREKRRANAECERVISAMDQVKSLLELMRLLVIDMSGALALASAAIFERTDDGGFLREAAVGWPAGTTWHLLPDDPLIRKVASTRDVVRFDEDPSSELDLPTGSSQPAIGLSLRANREVVALVLYGAHHSGAMLDPDEISALKRVVQEAGTVYGRLAALAAEYSAAALQERVMHLRTVH